jgi:hypothetical protein
MITIIYPISGPSVTLTLPESNFEEESGYIAADVIKRALNGTMTSYRPYLKRRKPLKWDYLTNTQKEELETLYAYGGPFTYVDEVDIKAPISVLMVGAPVFAQQYIDAWSGAVEVQEI